MIPEKIVDLGKIDFGTVEVPIEEIRKINLQRFEFEQLDGIFKLLPEEQALVGYKDIRSEEFWVRGHIPGNPLLPGVLMLEAGAQLCSYYQGKFHPQDGFFGFGGLEDVRFRGAVKPGDRMILVGKAVQIHPRKSTYIVHGFVRDKMVFQATVIGVTIKKEKSG